MLAPLTGPATRASLAPPGPGLWLSCPAALRDGMIETRTIYVGLIGVSLLHADEVVRRHSVLGMACRTSWE